MYLLNLTNQLHAGMANLPPEVSLRHARYLRHRQNDDGGFSGREGGSDLYYTSFALRGLALLDALAPEVAGRAAAFLRQRMTQSASVVDFYSLLHAAMLVGMARSEDLFAASPPDWPKRVADTLETFATPDGGYGKTPGAASGSTYHTFLVGLCYELLGRGYPRPEAVLRFVESRRRDDGGYVELAPLRRSGTNPTAAAVGIQQMIAGSNFQPARLAHVADFLVELRSKHEGGFRANGRVPLADLLSTFTGCWTLQQLQALDRIDTEAALAFVRSVEEPQGGFRGGLWDERSDVEYTFYGLGTLALLTPTRR